MNRDYFTTPIQGGGRDAYHYGHTSLSSNKVEPKGNKYFWIGLFLLTIIVIYHMV
jgi:hypothetical protein